MPDQAISAARIEQINQTARAFVSAFEIPIGPDQTREQFTAIFDPDVRWKDHAFLVRRAGHEAVLGLHKAWLHCNKPFTTKILDIYPTTKGCIVELLWIGRQRNDIVRPEGNVAVKASGKDFECHVCMILEIDNVGQIKKIDEYYNKRWGEGVNEAMYVEMKGASVKADNV